MVFTLISTLILGIAVAGLVMLGNHLVGSRLPRWLAPAAAGLAMLAYTIWTEYDWVDRTTRGLPNGLEVVRTYETSNILQPWTLVKPRINRLVALDRPSIETNENAPRYRKAALYLFARFEPPRELRQIYDCDQNRRIDLLPGETVDPTEIPDAGWEQLSDDPIVKEVCSGE
ncbi:hypothetical protein [Stappia sp. ES.058]|uniref:hypothetical protein n=1 Tax=Stappia sp. ES.058 TaxID=1881061 RepID=UPI00087952C2|nr:hypothetical protein [Stappia sp. ES.058]SDU41168.1 hypothetical protein SAMN05428979_3583 [Stappia sp. ES.058]